MSILKRLFGRTSSEVQGPSLLIGHAGKREIVIPIPCVIRHLGSVGKGRQDFLYSVMRQCLEKNQPIIYFDAAPNGRALGIFRTLADRYGNVENIVAASINASTTASDIGTIITASPFVYLHADILEMPAASCLLTLEGLITGLVGFLQSRIALGDTTTHRLIVIENSIAYSRGHVEKLDMLASFAQLSNTSIVLSDMYAEHDLDCLDEHTTCSILHGCDLPEMRAFHRLHVERHDPSLAVLQQMQEGEAIVISGNPLLPTSTVKRVRLMYTPISSAAVKAAATN